MVGGGPQAFTEGDLEPPRKVGAEGYRRAGTTGHSQEKEKLWGGAWSKV